MKRSFEYNNHSNNNNNNGFKKRQRFEFDRSNNRQANSRPMVNDNEAFLKMTKSIIDYYNENNQTFEMFEKKQQLRDAIFAMFKDIFPYLGIYIVGSSANGFGSNKSDVDMCVMVSHEDVDQKTEAPELLKLMSKCMRCAGFIRRLNFINAKVPIIKFHDCFNRIDCDLNLNNHNGIRNTHLLKCYSELDWRVRPFVLYVKSWAKFHNINDAASQTISSYSLVLMCIFFLQSAVKPAILPVLQDMYPNKFHYRSDINELNLNDTSNDWKSENKQNLGELFFKFLEYYSNFDFRTNIISIRTGRLLNCTEYLRRLDDLSRSSWKHLCIEEPFELTNTARSVYDYYTFQRILRVIRTSHQVLKRNKNIDELFVCVFEED